MNQLYTSEYFRRVHNLASNTRESVVMACTPIQWLALCDAYTACGWDLTPDQWTPEQRDAAIAHGIPPEWDDRGRYVRPKACAGFYIDATTGEIHVCPACNWEASNAGGTSPRPAEVAEYVQGLYTGLPALASVGWLISFFDHTEGEILRDEETGTYPDGASCYAPAAKALSERAGAVIAVRRWVW